MLGARRPRQPAPPPRSAAPAPATPCRPQVRGARGPAARDGRTGGQTDAVPVVRRRGGRLRSGQPPQPPPHLSLSPRGCLRSGGRLPRCSGSRGGRSGGGARREKFWPPLPAQNGRGGPGGREAAAPRGAGLPPPRAGSGAGADRSGSSERRGSAELGLRAPPLGSAGPLPRCAPPPGAPGPRTRHLRAAGRARQRLGATCRSPAPAAPGRPPRSHEYL